MDTARKDEQVEAEILKTLQKQESTEVAIQREIGSISLQQNSRQRELLESLIRLHQSLRGPEDLLDKGSYSRPFPPKPARANGEPYKDAAPVTDNPFGRNG